MKTKNALKLTEHRTRENEGRASFPLEVDELASLAFLEANGYLDSWSANNRHGYDYRNAVSKALALAWADYLLITGKGESKAVSDNENDF
jgi:hypothetical protein